MNDFAAGGAGDGDGLMRTVLTESKRIAVVGISAKPDRPSHRIAAFLIDKGYDVVGVNPVLQEVLGVKVYPSIQEVPGTVDLVDVFRRSDAIPPIVDDAIAAGARAVWLQEGIVNEEAAATARAAGLAVVMDRCTLKEWNRLLGE